MDEVFVRQMARVFRRMYGATSLEQLLKRFGVDLAKDALDQQRQFAALGEYLSGELPQHAIGVAQASAARGRDLDKRTGETDDNAAPRSIAELDTIGIYARWNSAGRNRRADPDNYGGDHD